MARILVVSDNEQDFRVLQAATAGDSHYLQHTASGLDGCINAAQSRPDVVVIGERTADQDGLSVMRHMRHNLDLDSLLIMPLAQNEPAQRIAAYEAGADDTLPRPLDVAELALRLKALLRHRQEPQNHCLAAGALSLDTAAHLLYVGDRRVCLTPREFAILEVLMSTPGRTFSVEQLLDAVWGMGNTGNVRAHIQSIRRKAGEGVIETVNGFGYRVIL